MTRNPTSIRVLLVEDDEDDYVLTVELLHGSESFNFTTDWAASPAEARTLLAEDRHDICLMDYRLGATHGTDLVSEALQLGFSAPIIMLTGQDNTGVEIAAAAAGAVDYLVKDNLGREQLLRSIRYALARSEIQAERYERVRAEAASRAKSEFLAVLSHEIRTPLTAVIGYTELLQRQYGSRDQGLARQLDVIHRNGEHLLSLLNDTLDLSRIEAGRLDIENSTFALAPFVMETLALLRELAEHKRLDLRLDASDTLPHQIHSDPRRLRQILLNLLGNAVKFTDNGRVELHLRLVDTQLEFEVSDSGHGIPPEQMDAIFTPFTQLEPGKILGTGLGLAISRKLAERLGGSLTAQSTPGVGSRFTLRVDPGPLDMQQQADFGNSQETMRLPTMPQVAITGHVLVVDDASDVRELLLGLLREAGVLALGAANGGEALATLDRAGPGQITLVLMDLNMPGLDGFETLAALRHRGATMPVLALTAASMQGERERCLAAGFAAYLSKPIDMMLLLEEIARLAHKTAPAVLATTGTILVIEDNPDANTAICQLLELSGYHAQGALDIASAHAAFDRLQPALVLGDLHLGNEDGLALLTALHARHPDCRYLVLSGIDTPARMALPNFITGFIAKPLTLERLNAAVAAAFAASASDSTTSNATRSSNCP